MVLLLRKIEELVINVAQCYNINHKLLKYKSNGRRRTHLLNTANQNVCNDSSNKIITKNKPKKILFFGTDNFSVATLKEIHDWISKADNHNSENDQGEENQKEVRGIEVCTSQMKHLVQPVKIFAEQENLVVHTWPIEPIDIKNEGFDLGVIASFGHLIPKKVIEAFPLGILNVHASLLPRWRGASPITHSILAGDKLTGISIMEVKPHHFDRGHVLASETVNIGSDQTHEELTNILANVGAHLIVRVLNNLGHYRAHSCPQDESKATYAPCIDKSFYSINWASSTSRDVYNQSRALSGSGKLYTTWQDTGVKVMLSDCVKPDIVDLFTIELEENRHIKPGRVIYIKTKLKNNAFHGKQKYKKDRFICVKCKSGWIAFANLYYGTNKLMNAVDFFNGYISHDRSKPRHFIHEDTYKN